MPETILGEVANTTTVPDNVMEALVGEGKTYKTVEDLAKGKLNADIHIQKIELENKEMRDKLAGAKTVDDLLAKLEARTASVGNPNGSDDKTIQTNGALSAEQIAKIVNDSIQGRETANVKAVNKARAETRLKEIFGDKAKEVFEREAANPAVRTTLLQLAEIDPDKFVSFFQKETTKTGVDNGQNGMNLNVNLQDNSALVPGTERFYADMRKKNPGLYYSTATQLEIHDAATKNPNRYFGN